MSAPSQTQRVLAVLADVDRPQWAKKITVAETGCWLWAGANTTGYGYVTFHRKNWLVHRLFFEILNGPIPKGMQLHHECGQRGCVNPSHLVVVSQAEHSAKHGYPGITEAALARAEKTHCFRDHEFTPENTRIKLNGVGRGYSRVCRACSRLSDRARRARRKARQ